MKKEGDSKTPPPSFLSEDLLVPETVVGDYDEATNTWTLMVLRGEADGPWPFRRAVALGWTRKAVERSLLLDLFRAHEPTWSRRSFEAWLESLDAPEIQWSLRQISLTSLL
ncbi:MAG: hypothetical protein AAFZ18_00965 [Myxococcota bacterium]